MTRSETSSSPSGGESGATRGPNWSWGSSPGKRCGYGSGSSRSPDGLGRGWGFGSGGGGYGAGK
ncbi:hypothetical protein R3W88_015260 [Solanum pinnatisectum]|uniref:Glycine-rich protein n=1 Tax=Solanum pinnatisectum TaxID=50273 RepID=A0AAV9KYC3_9SOLN|nr:hypothetical protein R3W88_015260 [Solanum pinnatisectum]